MHVNKMPSKDTYTPGNCNIGPQEIRVRKLFLRFFGFITLVATGAALFWCQSLPLWCLLLFLSFSFFTLYLEIHHRFCILFGFFNLYNFKQLGHLDHVTAKEHVRKDRRRVLEMILQSFAFAVVFASLVHYLGTKLPPH